MTADSDIDATANEDGVRRAQDAVGDTVQNLGEQLNPRALFDSFTGGNSAGNARQAWDIARENPAPVALIAVGAAWLLATSETAVVRGLRDRLIGRLRGAVGLETDIGGPASSGPPPETGGEFDRRQPPGARS